MNPLFKRLFLPVCLLALLWVACRSLAPTGQRGDKPALPRGKVHCALSIIAWSLCLFTVACSAMSTSTGTAVQAPKTVATDQSVTSRATPTTPPLGTRYDPRYTNSDHTDRVTMVTWSPNDRYIASASADQTVQVVDALSGKMLFQRCVA